MGCGESFLSAALLEAYPSMRVVALDGSEEMRTAAGARLERFGSRAEVRDFDLHAQDWLSEAGFAAADCFWMFGGHAIYGGYASREGGSAPVDYEGALEIVHGVLGE